MKSILTQESSNKNGQQTRVKWKDGDGERTRQEKKGAAVLTTESLTALSKEVCNKGLVLAMLLNIPTTRLVNMSMDQKFDQGTNLDKTLSMLQYWKKMRETAKEKDKVFDLERGLREAGFVDIADAVADRHKENMELTADCFPVS